MTTLSAPTWNDLWINKDLAIRQVAGSAMIEVHGVRGYLLPGDIQFLWNMAATLPTGGRHVEIGSWMGLSTILFANSLIAHLNFDARIHCIDTWQGSQEHQGMAEVENGALFDTFLANVRRANVQHFVRPLRGDSKRMAANFDDHSLDSIFVDGDHSYAGCRADLEAWLPKLKRGGRIAGHDAVPGEGVDQAVREFAKAHGLQLEILPPPQGHYVWEYHGV
ncbi:MAG: class I SAM-dependent methyltransferase [Planctomycetes bacterium]|jgi:predicted O-methyltransferase YrrM|nr:class I SAM-dependent methyltransferase [Planctomycetota bacterium]MCC7062832.1 class I SAM-dependent methyltransferase [Planctomycetota bacterium]